jgi:hypothetical protein
MNKVTTFFVAHLKNRKFQELIVIKHGKLPYGYLRTIEILAKADKIHISLVAANIEVLGGNRLVLNMTPKSGDPLPSIVIAEIM